MRKLLAALLVLACAVSAHVMPAQDDLADRLVERGREAADAGNMEEAVNLWRDAIYIAENRCQPRTQVRALIELAVELSWNPLEGVSENECTDLARAAHKLAIELGDDELERKAIEAVVATVWDDETRTIMDYVVAGGFDSTLESSLHMAWDADRAEAAKLYDEALAIMDARALARIHIAGKRMDAALKVLTAAAEKAKSLGWTKTQLVLLQEAATLNPELRVQVRRLHEERGALVPLARMDCEDAPARAQDDELVKWSKRVSTALDIGIRAGDHVLQEQAAKVLSRLTGDARFDVVAVNARRRARSELLRSGERALGQPDLLTPALELQILGHSGDSEFDRLIRKLGLIEPEPPTEAQQQAFVTALEKALKDKDSTMRLVAVQMADIAQRPEALEAIFDNMQFSLFRGTAAIMVQGLAGEDQIPLLLSKLTGEFMELEEICAAELFRINKPGLEADIKKALGAVMLPDTRVWLNAYLARYGDADALKEVQLDLTSKLPYVRQQAQVALLTLGYGTPYKALYQEVKTDPGSTVCAVNRLPRHMGLQLIYPLAKAQPIAAARMLAKRQVPGREVIIKDNNLLTVAYCQPQDEREAATCGTAQIDRIQQGRRLGGANADYFNWLAQRAGMSGNELNDTLASADGESPIREAARADMDRTALLDESTVRTLTLIDEDPCGKARITITSIIGNAEIVDGHLVVPFNYDYTVKWVASGMLGAMYRDVMGQMNLASLFGSCELELPGHEPVKGEGGQTLKGEPALRFLLPKKIGEGLGDDEPIDRETVLQGSVIVKFMFIDNPGQVSFPVRALELPESDQPDLVAEELLIDPALPEYNRPARVTLIARNKGSTVRSDVLGMARIYARNPQGPDGWRTIASFVVPMRGWQPGEVRTYETRPLAVDGYFMNAYSQLYDPLKGDTQLQGHIDADNAVPELDEENNSTQIELPLYLPDDLALPLAQDEAMKALEQPLADMLKADNMDELLDAYGRAADIIQPLENLLPEIKLAAFHLNSRYETVKAGIRAKEALERLERYKREGTLTRERLKQVQGDLEKCQEALLDSGIPVPVTTLEKARNFSMAGKNVIGVGGDIAKLQNIAGLGDRTDGPLGSMGGHAKKLDGALLLAIETQRMIEEGKADAGNLLPAASNFVDGLGIKNATPAFSNLHQAMFKAEVEYATKGFDKSSDALNAITALMDDPDSEAAQQRLTNAVNEVDKHLSAGPFNENTIKDIAKGYVKDIPVFGKIFSTLAGWK